MAERVGVKTHIVTHEDKIVKQLLKNGSKAGNYMRTAMLDTVQARMLRGDGQHPYSTNPTWYNTTRPKGAIAKFQKFLASQGAKGRAKRRRFIFMPRGYAQWRGIFKGIGFRLQPVNFQLTGQMFNNMRGRMTFNKEHKTIRSWIGFKRQSRTYGRLTNTELAFILNERGSFPMFELQDKEADEIIEKAIDILFDAIK